MGKGKFLVSYDLLRVWFHLPDGDEIVAVEPIEWECFAIYVESDAIPKGDIIELSPSWGTMEKEGRYQEVSFEGWGLE